MKTSAFSLPYALALGISALLLLPDSALAQGKKVRNEMERYLAAPSPSSGGVEHDIDGSSLDSKELLHPSETSSTRPTGTAPHSIGGQQVNEANSVIFKAFDLHKEWKDMLVVTDWTGSMYSYTGQVMKWHRDHIDQGLVGHLVLFNDGDDKLRGGKPKVIGETGGIYHVDPLNLDDFLSKVETAVDAGGGGDNTENDVEAILAGLDAYNNGKGVILIADNSPMRDLSLVSRVTVPVHVVLCDGGWVKDYVQLAYRTGGSVTTMSDYLDFSDPLVGVGGHVMFNGINYAL